MHVHKKLCDIVLRTCMLSFTGAAIIIATIACMYLEMFSTTTVSCFTPASARIVNLYEGILFLFR